MKNIVTVYVQLLEEGSPAMRGTDAEYLGDGLYKILPTPYYNPEDEIWEFLPYSVVKCNTIESQGESVLLAVKEVQ